MGSDRSAPGRRSWAGGPFSGRETAARPWLLPLLLVLLDCLGRCAAAEDAEVHVAEGKHKHFSQPRNQGACRMIRMIQVADPCNLLDQIPDKAIP